jgi:hypothetical protein
MKFWEFTEFTCDATSRAEAIRISVNEIRKNRILIAWPSIILIKQSTSFPIWQREN